MKLFLFFFLLCLALLFETTLTSLPLVLIVLICFSVLYQRAWILIVVFFAGIILDALSLRFLGSSSMFFLIFLGLVFLYERKFEIQTVPFVLIASLVGSVTFLKIFGYSMILEQSFAAMLAGILLFLLCKNLLKITSKYSIA